jgi:enterochelin esterase family protein
MSIHPLLARARRDGNPVLENDRAVFVWEGKAPVLLLDDFHGWEEHPVPLERAAPNLWTISLDLKPDTYLEYAFLDPASGQRLPDPLNPRTIWNEFDAYNHYFYMPRGRPTELAVPVKGMGRGAVTRHRVPTQDQAAGSKRTVHLYRPPADGPVPLLVVYDGTDYLRRGRLNFIADTLIASRRVSPFAMALVQNGGAARNLEYSCSDATLAFLQEGVLPLARKELDLLPPGGGRYGILGASLGGLMALYTGMRMPGIFGRVLSQSGAFFLPDFEFVVADLVRHAPGTGIHVWMDAGRYEWLLDGNRKMARLLRKRGYALTYREFSGGHNYTCWRNDIPHGLEALFA